MGLLEPLILDQIGQQPVATAIVFTTTAYEALHTPPLCHPAAMLHKKGVKVVSFDLPLHDQQTPTYEGVKRWTNFIEKTGRDPLSPFLEQIQSWIEQQISDDMPLLLVGISRGAFIAAHLSVRMKKNYPLILFSPMLHLNYPWLFEQQALKPGWIQEYNLICHINFLKNSPIFFSVGNNDERTLTTDTIQFFQQLIDAKAIEQKRGSPLNLRVFPSIGMFGHGTPDDIFMEGITWALKWIGH
jgi:hypothetical protein